MGGLSPLGAPSLLGGGGAGLGHVPDRPWDLQPLSRLNTPQRFLSGPCRVSEVKRSFITRSAAFGLPLLAGEIPQQLGGGCRGLFLTETRSDFSL